jgi:hypothetical protein
MTNAETLASWLLLPVLLTCLWRARLLALAILPPLAFAFIQWHELVDTSSASHPLRWGVSVVSLSVALLAASLYASNLNAIGSPRGRWLRTEQRFVGAFASNSRRALAASIIVFASGCADVPALHPIFWARFAEWALTPLQIGACFAVIGVLCVPERWVQWKNPSP